MRTNELMQELKNAYHAGRMPRFSSMRIWERTVDEQVNFYERNPIPQNPDYETHRAFALPSSNGIVINIDKIKDRGLAAALSLPTVDEVDEAWITNKQELDDWIRKHGK